MKTKKNTISPNYVSGLIQADGSFFVIFEPRKNSKHGIRVRPKFSLTLDFDSKEGCQVVQQFFGNIGNIYQNKKTHSVEFIIENLENLSQFVIPHFIKYPLFGPKRVSFSIFSKIVHSLTFKQHYDKSFFAVMISMAFFMNTASQRTEKRKKQLWSILGEKQNECSSIINEISKTSISKKKERELDLDFLIGLIEGDGSFFINFLAHKKIKLGFHITAHSDQTLFFEEIKKTLGCGSVVDKTPFLIRYLVNDLNSLKNVIIPLIEKGSFYTKKKEYFEIFKQVVYILLDIKNKKNIESDIIKIINIAYDMNLGGKRRKLTKKEYLLKYVHCFKGI